MESSSQPPFSISRDTEFDDRNHQLSLSWKIMPMPRSRFPREFAYSKGFYKKRCKMVAVIMTIKCIPHLDYCYFTLTKKITTSYTRWISSKSISHSIVSSIQNLNSGKPTENHATFHESCFIIESVSSPLFEKIMYFWETIFFTGSTMQSGISKSIPLITRTHLAARKLAIWRIQSSFYGVIFHEKCCRKSSTRIQE